MKITKKQLKEMVRAAVREHLSMLEEAKRFTRTEVFWIKPNGEEVILGIAKNPDKAFGLENVRKMAAQKGIEIPDGAAVFMRKVKIKK